MVCGEGSRDHIAFGGRPKDQTPKRGEGGNTLKKRGMGLLSTEKRLL